MLCMLAYNNAGKGVAGGKRLFHQLRVIDNGAIVPIAQPSDVAGEAPLQIFAESIPCSKVVMLVGSSEKPVSKKATIENADGSTDHKLHLTFPKCYSLLDESRAEPIEVVLFCSIEDAGDYA